MKKLIQILKLKSLLLSHRALVVLLSKQVDPNLSDLSEAMMTMMVPEVVVEEEEEEEKEHLRTRVHAQTRRLSNPTPTRISRLLTHEND